MVAHGECRHDGIRDINDGANVVETPAAKLTKYMEHLADARAKGMQVREDSEVMFKITAALQKGPGDEDLVVLLEELDGFVHQIDNVRKSGIVVHVHVCVFQRPPPFACGTRVLPATGTQHANGGGNTTSPVFL